jgi:putative Holliday junction resolvase
VRVLGVDFGQRRIGLAVSDASATLARPWKTLSAGATPRASAALVAAAIGELRTSDADDLEAIVVGVPRRLNGEETDQTQPARDFAAALHDASGLPVREQDERLTSHEADRLLAIRERDWRARKAKLDAASAAVILQDYLDDRHQREARQ